MEEIEIEGSRGVAHLVFRFPDTKKQAHVHLERVLKGVVGEPHLTPENAAAVPFAVLDCRGCEPVRWALGAGFRAISSGGGVFEDVDLSDDWADFDEEHDLSVSIMGASAEVRTLTEPKKGKGKPSW